MTDLKTHLSEVLSAEARGRGFAGASVVDHPGDEPYAVWVPESSEEPAFLAFSITKTFTATLILQLCEQGALGLDDSVTAWYPRLTGADRVSVRQLLNHTAGIPDYGSIPAYHEAVRSSPSEPWSFDRFAAETLDKGLLFPPGTGWAYSNPGYMLLKRIAEEVTGVSYRELISERIALRLGLRRTFVAESITDLAPLARGISSMLAPDGQPRDVRAYYHPGWVSHGVVASTATDIVRFLDRLFAGELLSQRSLREMMALIPVSTERDSGVTTGDFPLRPGMPAYGLGLMGDTASPWGLIAGHNGGGPCYGASAFHAFDLGGASVCAIGAIEEDFRAERVVAAMLDFLKDMSSTPLT